MRKWWLLPVVLAASAASAVPVWRWVDEHGVIHYSDRPVEGAERIEVSSAQSFPSLQRGTAQARGEPPPGEQTARYARFEVVRPAQQETLWNIGGTLEIELMLEPPLQPGHRLDVYLDGERRHLAASSTRLTVPEVYRGVHSLEAVIVDERGSELLRSTAVTFMVQQTSIQNPNNRTPPAARN